MTQESGIHGYSGPNKAHVVFSASPDNIDLVEFMLTRWYGAWPNARWGKGIGQYKGKREPSFWMEAEDFFSDRYKFLRYIIHDQESILYLSPLGAQNRRKALLVYNEPVTKFDCVNHCEDLGVWYSVSPTRANKQDSWSYFDDVYYITHPNPSPDIATEKEREITQLIYDLRQCILDNYPQGVETKHNQLLFRTYQAIKGKTLPNGEIIR